jgi:hypothetical protein
MSFFRSGASNVSRCKFAFQRWCERLCHSSNKFAYSSTVLPERAAKKVQASAVQGNCLKGAIDLELAEEFRVGSEICGPRPADGWRQAQEEVSVMKSSEALA